MSALIRPEELEALKSIDSSMIANVVESFAVRGRTEGYCGAEVRCLFPSLGRMVGHAVTVLIETTGETRESRVELRELWDLVHASLKPAVLVFAHIAHDIDRSCCFGGNFARLATRLGAVGLVTNGGVRDLQEVEPLGFKYFARGAVASHGNYHFVQVGKPVTVSGLRVNLGDLIVGDVNGVVSVPPELRLSDLLERARGMAEAEAEFCKLIDSPRFDWTKIGSDPNMSFRDALRRAAT